MTESQIVQIMIAMLNGRYIAPGKDNEKTAKEVAKIYRILKDKTYDEDSSDEEEYTAAAPQIIPPPNWGQ